jgi:molecular chaperone IbpA
MTRTLDYYIPRASVGFDRLFDQIERQLAGNSNSSYPPFNIVELAENEWLISIAVAGFAMENLNISLDKSTLTVEGTPPKTEEVKYVHRGIAGRSFKRTFALAEHVEVTSAQLELGVLNISLVRRVPEEKQPKLIPIISK